MTNMKEHKKPLSEKEWEFWEDRLGFFIQEFDDNVGSVSREAIEVGEGNNHDHFLAGMSQGMWAIYTFVKDRMVQSDNSTEKNRVKRKYRKSGKYRKANVVMHMKLDNEIRGRKTKAMSSKDVLNLFMSRHNKSKLNIKEIFGALVKQGKVPGKYNFKKNKKVLNDRLYMLTKTDRLKVKKINKRNYYSLR